ncbi:hypothetical protein [Paucisalibacillus globulus]|uniref:hypothetical protein n=1 Tax=Paucisalibacillus globulus TaxID=351095 RepID=UPI0004026962|nr:hypothetical protein [Paucisalibacillus globulus]
MNESKTNDKKKSLRLVSPRLYNYITEKLEDKHNIHSYDLQIDASLMDEGIEIAIRFGETFSNIETKFFTHEQVKEISKEVKEFVAQTGEACTEVLIDDYFKIHAP